MRVVVSGASGLIGSALTGSLRADDHTVIALVRREARGEHESSWDPAAHLIDHDLIASAIADAIVVANPSVILLQGSAMGYYGDKGSLELTEGASPGEGFLADVCQSWEASAQPAVDAGASVAYLRT